MRLESLGINITKNCNINCAHCLCGEPLNEYITKEVVEHIFDDVDSVGELFLTGGEPLLRPDLIKMVKDVLQEKNVKPDKISLTTNGTLFEEQQKEALLYLFKGAKKKKMYFSNDYFHKEAIKEYYKKNKKPYFSYTFSELIENIACFCIENDINFESSGISCVGLMGRAKNLDKSLSTKLGIPFINVSRTFVSLGNYDISNKAFKDIVSVDTTGNVLHCDYENTEVEELSIGNILTNNIEDILYNRCIDEMRRNGIKVDYEDKDRVDAVIKFCYARKSRRR